MLNILSKNELDSGFMLENMRFRANFYQTLQGPAVVLRKVETTILDMESLNLPPAMYSIVHKRLSTSYWSYWLR